MNVEITKLNKRFTRTFYCGLRDDIGSIIEKRNDLSPSEMYELAEVADQELKARRESQQIYTHRLLRGGFIDPPFRPKGLYGGMKETITNDRIRTTNITTQSAKQEVVRVVNRYG